MVVLLCAPFSIALPEEEKEWMKKKDEKGFFL
jgi:hypothetical protein